MTLTQQWVLDSQQVVNWGCFEKWWKIRFPGARHVTIISGFTGAGKSTLLDANTVLMQPSRKRLNRASNSMAVGRARGEDERNIVSYMRGKVDRTREDGEQVDKVLRAGSVFSAIAQTWHNADGSVLTAFVVYFARPEDRTTPSEKRFGWVEGEFDLRDLEPYTQGQHLVRPLSTRAIRRDLPHVRFEDNQTALHRVLWQCLGIGTDGDGAHAMELLHRVQASEGIESVDDLFTQLVLDRPATFAKAAEAVQHFERLRAAHEKVTVIEDQTRRLGPITERWGSYQKNREAARFFLDLGHVPDLDGTILTPFWKWARTREYEVLEVAEISLGRRYLQAVEKRDAASSEIANIAGRLADNAAKRAANDGERLDRINEDIRRATKDREAAELHRGRLQEAVEQHFNVPASAEGWHVQALLSQQFVDDYEQARQAATQALEQVLRSKFEHLDRKRLLEADRKHFAQRGDVLPDLLTRIREQYAEVTGIPVEDLRFVAELIDMEPEWEGWRGAAELTLGGFATRLLVPVDRAADFRALTDSVRTVRRIRSMPASRGLGLIADRDPGYLSGRFQFRDHPYSGWLSEQLRRRFSYVCVEDGEALNALPRGTSAVALSGQVRHGNDGGEHGGQLGAKRIIGFSPQALLEEIAGEVAEIEVRLDDIDRREKGARAPVARLEQERIAHGTFLRTTWAVVDAESSAQRLRELDRQREAVRANKVLAALDDEQRGLRAADTAARAAEYAAGRRASDLDGERGLVAERKDRAWDHLVLLDEVEEPDMDRLDGLLAQFLGSDPVTPEVMQHIGRFIRFLTSEGGAASSRADKDRLQLATVFADFLRDYPDDDLGDDPDRFYPQFWAILDGLLASGVEGAQLEFADYTATFSGLEIMHLNTAYQNELETINRRLAQINAILRDQPYGADGRERISIVSRSGGTPDVAIAFLKQLNALTSHSTRGLTYEEALGRFASFQEVIAQIADPKQAAPLLDVRTHVRLEAQRHDVDGNLVAFHDSLGEKSGGEMQELTMFIVATAIRYQVGSLGDATPRFAPVFLDEGMVKADPETTQRAVDVWKRLGFQVIIAVPLDKHESVMPTASACWAVSKGRNHRSRIDLISDPALWEGR